MTAGDRAGQGEIKLNTSSREWKHKEQREQQQNELKKFT